MVENQERHKVFMFKVLKVMQIMFLKSTSINNNKQSQVKRANMQISEISGQKKRNEVNRND